MKSAFKKYQNLLERSGTKEQKRNDYYQIINEFYDENIIQVENSEEPIHGKEKLLELENKNFDRIMVVETQLNDVVFDEKSGIVWGQMIIKFHSIQSGAKRIEEAFFQKWSNEKIQYQRFFYGPFIKEANL